MSTDLMPAGRRWRPMTAPDLPAVAAIAGRIHPSYPEDDAVFAERLRLYPDGCLVLEAELGLLAYAISHPWRQLQPPVLNTLLGTLPEMPSTYYIHDLALLPQARGTGAGSTLVARLLEVARAAKLPQVSLVAVNRSREFWRRHGFEVIEAPTVSQKLLSYDATACLMARSLG